jgi:adenylylsulfate kinase-like enzyme
MTAPCRPARGDAASVSAPVWLITGAQASGKSTVADLLARRFERSVHVRGGQFYRWGVRGWKHFDDPDRAEARRLLDLRYKLSAMVADKYAAAGLTVVVQDTIYSTDVVTWINGLRARPVHLVVLRPSVDVVEQRHEERRKRLGKITFRDAYTAALNDCDVATMPRDFGLWLDTSQQTSDETVDEILARSAEAVVSDRECSGSNCGSNPRVLRGQSPHARRPSHSVNRKATGRFDRGCMTGQ